LCQELPRRIATDGVAALSVELLRGEANAAGFPASKEGKEDAIMPEVKETVGRCETGPWRRASRFGHAAGEFVREEIDPRSSRASTARGRQSRRLPLD